MLEQGWGTCVPRAKRDPREHLVWPTSEFRYTSWRTTSRQNEAPW